MVVADSILYPTYQVSFYLGSEETLKNEADSLGIMAGYTSQNVKRTPGAPWKDKSRYRSSARSESVLRRPQPWGGCSTSVVEWCGSQQWTNIMLHLC